jgi:hypothetical protein
VAMTVLDEIARFRALTLTASAQQAKLGKL